jgi:hypothetical protein
MIETGLNRRSTMSAPASAANSTMPVPPGAVPSPDGQARLPARATSGTDAVRPTATSARPGRIVLLRRALALAFGVVQVLLVLRLALLAFGAGNNALVRLALQASATLESPFSNMFRVNQIPTGAGSFVDVTALVALLGWTLLQGFLLAVLSLGAPSRR